MRRIVGDLINMNVFSAVSKKIQKKGCAIKSDPYNAPPSTRRNGLRNAVFSRRLPGVSAGEKLLKKR
ncbi:hypothetical protein ACTUSQ_23405, partial [Pantoea ananatis]